MHPFQAHLRLNQKRVRYYYYLCMTMHLAAMLADAVSSDCGLHTAKTQVVTSARIFINNVCTRCGRGMQSL